MTLRQMGHLLVCVLSSFAQVWHMHMWRQGSAVVSRGALMQMTHLSSSSTILCQLQSHSKCTATFQQYGCTAVKR